MKIHVVQIILYLLLEISTAWAHWGGLVEKMLIHLDFPFYLLISLAFS